VADGLDFLKPGVIAPRGRLFHQATCPSWKIFGLDGSLGVEPRNVGIALADSLCELGSRPPWLGKAGRAPFELYPDFALQVRKSTEYISQISRVLAKYTLPRLGRHFRDNLGWPAEHQSTLVSREWFQPDFGRRKCLPNCRTKGFPASANFESKFSVNALMGLPKNGIPNTVEFACY
jgi:hypothetical protein